MNTDLYTVLESYPTSSTEDIKKNYFRLAKLYHPDVAGDKPENRERFKHINEAYTTLSDPQKRQEYDESLRRKKIDSKDATALRDKDQKSASIAFRQAKESMRDGFYDKAVILLKTAMRHSPDNPTYMSWYGFSLAMTGKNLHEARDACKKAVQVEFYNSDYHSNLGFVYFKAGLKNQAIKHFREAIKWNASNAIANRYLEKLDSGKLVKTGPIDKLFNSVKTIFSH